MSLAKNLAGRVGVNEFVLVGSGGRVQNLFKNFSSDL
jgi:hypothetical protein